MSGMKETVELRVWGTSELPTLVYLPGLHGDWTLIGGLRKALAGRVRFVEMAYPRTLEWSLEDYAAAVADALARQGITTGWLLAESFGSQVVWPLAANASFHAEGIILAGGFTGYPLRVNVRLAEALLGFCPARFWLTSLRVYGHLARLRFRRVREVVAAVDEFVARRTDPDRKAWVHRLHLIAGNNPLPLVQAFPRPVFALTGWLDPIVPWPLVRPAIRKQCPQLQEYRVTSGDHNVLSTAPQKASALILRWMGVEG